MKRLTCRVYKVLTTALLVVIAWGGCINKENPQQNGSFTHAIDILIDTAFALQYNNALACDSIAQIIYTQSQQNNYPKGVANAWFLKSSAQQQLGNYDTAIALAEKALEIFIKINDEEGQARIYNDLGIDYDFKADYAKAIDNYLKALTLFEKLKDTKGQSNAYNNIGLIYQNQSNYRVAEGYHKKALKIAQENNYPAGELNAINSMGSVYKELGNYDSSLKYFLKLLEADIQSGNKSYISYSYNNVGEVYRKLGDFDKAIFYFEKSKKLKQELGNKRALANTLENLGDVHIDTREFDKADEYLQQGLAIAIELQLLENQKDIYNLLHQLETQRQNYKQALTYFKQAEKIKDEISQDKEMAKISQLEKDYEVEKAKRQLTETKSKAKLSGLLALVYGGITIVLLILLSAVWLSFKQKQKNNKLLLTYQKELQQINQELEEKNLLVLAQKKEVEVALATRSRFLSFMSHEIRTPLNGITGLVDLLMAMPMLPDQHEYMEALKLSADNLVMLLNNILDLSRLEAGKIDLEKGRVDMRKLISEQALLFKASAKLKEVDLEVSIADDVPAKLQGDSYRISQILANLINNAVKFTRKGKIEISCSVLQFKAQTYTLNIAVSDEGIGISKENLKTILEPFAQAEAHTTRKYGGTGLGLSIVQLLLDAMDSQLEIESEPKVGSTFSFKLNLPVYEAPILHHEGFNADTGIGEELIANKKILVVEDNTTNVLVLTKVLAKWRVEYDVADNGFKAIEYADQKKYDVILMDLHLPKITGYETAQRIKLSGNINSKTPILAITAADESEIEQHPQKHFLDGVMYKPVQTQVLLQSIKKLLA